MCYSASFLPQTTNSGVSVDKEVLASLVDAIRRGDLKEFLRAVNKLPNNRASTEEESKLLLLAIETNQPGIVQAMLVDGWCNTRELLEEIREITFSRSKKEREFWTLDKLVAEYKWHDLLGAVHNLDCTGHFDSKLKQAQWAAQAAGDIDFFLAVGGRLQAWLFEACIKGDVKMAERLLGRGRYKRDSIQECEKAAIKGGHKAILELLLAHLGTTQDLKSLLDIACENEQVELIHWLIAQGADVNRNRSECLQFSVSRGLAKSVVALLQEGAEVNSRPWSFWLWDACTSKSSATLRALLTMGAGCRHMESWELVKKDAEKRASCFPAELMEVFKAFRWDEAAGRVVENV